MTGTTRSSANLDPRRRKLLYHAWHRGMREMDLVLGSFADAEIESLSDKELDALECLMAENDADLLNWIMGSLPIPSDKDSAVFRKILNFRPVATS